MRILLAKLLVAATGLLIILLAIAFATIRNAPDNVPVAAPGRVAPVGADTGVALPPMGDTSGPHDARAAAVARGRAVYAEQRCGTCHSIAGLGNTRSPLDGVGKRLTEREIRRWIVAPREMNPAVAKRGYQLPDADLDALVAFLTAGDPR